MYLLTTLKISKHKYSPSKTHTHTQKHRYTNRRGDEKNTGNSRNLPCEQVTQRNNSVVDLHYPT